MALLAALLGMTPAGAGSGDADPGQAPRPPDAPGSGFVGRLSGFRHVARERGLTLGLDVALYDQWASETRSGSANLTTLTWQLGGRWRLPHTHPGGAGELGWNFLGSQGIGAGSAAGETLSGNVGSISGLNANVLPDAVALDELFWRQEAVDGRWALLVGRVDQASHFDSNRVANDGYTQFLAFAFENNLSIPWPAFGGFGGVLRLDPGTGGYLLASVAAVNDNPRIPWSAAGHEGWNQMLEIGSTQVVPGLGRGHVRLTPWHSRLPGASGFGVGLNLDQELGGRRQRGGPDGHGEPGSRLIGFLRAGVGEPAVTPVSAFASGGVAVEGPFGRPRDRLALGVAWSDPSPGAGERGETLIEGYYRFVLSPALSLTPDLQIVVDPALDSAAGSTAVFGLRLHLRL